MRSEAVYKNTIIKELEKLFPGCYILKNNPEETQGIPDIIILFGNKWAALEFKKCDVSNRQPNQDFYITLFDEMSFASFISPENEEEVLDALQSTFRSDW